MAVWLFLVGIVVGPAQAQTLRGGEAAVDTVTVRQAVDQALRRNRELRAVRQEVPAEAAELRATQSERFPLLQGQAEYRRLSENVDYTADIPGLPSGDQTITFAPAILDRYVFRARVEQPIFSGFRTQRAVEAARHRVQAARSRVAATEDEVAYRVRAAYWRLYETQKQRRAARQALRQIERQLTDVRNRRDAGTATESDVLRVKARHATLRVERMQATHDVEQARLTLNDLMGRSTETPVVIADTVTLAPPPPDVSVLVEQALQQQPELAALRREKQAVDADVSRVRAAWYPEVRLVGSYLYARPNEQLFPFEDEFAGTWEAGLTASWSLWTGGRTAAQSDRAEARRTQATYELAHAREQITVEVRRQHMAVQQAREGVTAATVAVESARAAYGSVRSRFDAGMTVTADLLDAERSLRQARARLAQAQARYATARAALVRAAGGPW